ncbi:hypothetical protein [Shewanella sp. GD04112]|uniref:hypothetical protein n=1 Tax=Shewanella sp. GD04112 TaxID=2975434 RepID=UPI00244BCC5D|nr:hypothetical protein [Shewanella sp. GD04112]MDH0448097.1 hypothetical protein [Shewanella sp. GD04112]
MSKNKTLSTTLRDKMMKGILTAAVLLSTLSIAINAVSLETAAAPNVRFKPVELAAAPNVRFKPVELAAAPNVRFKPVELAAAPNVRFSETTLA